MAHTSRLNRSIVAAGAFMALALLLPHHASNAQTAASNPITIVVPYAPGAQADLNMRLVAKKVTENGGSQIVIKNMPGAGTVVGAVNVKTSAPDGNTLLQMTVAAQLTNEMTMSPPPFVTAKDFEAITVLWGFPLTVVVPASSSAKTMADLIQSARTSTSGRSYGSPGVNTGSHFLGRVIAQKTGVSLVHVPYRGAAPAVVDLTAGRIDMLFVSYSSVAPYVQNGDLRVLAVANPTRLAALPNVPTLAEAGFPDIEMGTQFGLLAPAATPKAIVKKLADEFGRAARDPAIVSHAASQGIEIQTTTPEEFAALIADQTKKLELLLRSLTKGTP
jgi:tripartite-type tricarboxylate transporter receptor subunit TctC